MSYIIIDGNKVYITIRLDHMAPEWTSRPDRDHLAYHFTTKEEAVRVRDELRAMGVKPKIVKSRKPKAHILRRDSATVGGNKLGIDSVMRFRHWLDNRRGRRRLVKQFPGWAGFLNNEEWMSRESDWDADLNEKCGKGLLSPHNLPSQRYNRSQLKVPVGDHTNLGTLTCGNP